jgi:hypothetical protein
VDLSVPVTAADPVARPPIVTPIGDGFSGVVTAAAISSAVEARDGAARSEDITAVLATGEPVPVRVPSSTTDPEGAVDDDGLVVVELAEWTAGAMAVAPDLPEVDDMVVVLTDPPVRVPLARVAEVGAPDGTPVVDDHGDLVGLCSDDGHGRRVLTTATLAVPIDDAGDATDPD